MIPGFGVGPFILMYHAIDDHPNDPYSVTVDAFLDQLSWLSRNGFEVVSLLFLLRSIEARKYGALRKKVVITFDDGYKDFVTNALPILQQHGATATVFLVTEMPGGRSSWNQAGPDMSLMSEDEVRYIKAQGISLGSHTSTHARLTLLEHGELQRQLRDSHDALTRLGETFHSFAYPFGQWSSGVVDAVQAAGYECAVAVGEQTRFTAADRYLLPRVTMRRDMDMKRFQSLLKRTGVEMELRRRYRMVRTMRSGAPTNS